MKSLLLLLIATLLSAPLATAQKLDLSLPALASKAKEKTEVDVDGASLGKALKDGKLGAKIPANMGEVHVRNYEFSASGEYSEKDLEPLRKQLAATSNWQRIIYAKEKNESAEIFVFSGGERISGLLVIACEPTELSLVHIIGDMSQEQLKEMVSSTIRYPDLPQR